MRSLIKQNDKTQHFFSLFVKSLKCYANRTNDVHKSKLWHRYNGDDSILCHCTVQKYKPIKCPKDADYSTLCAIGLAQNSNLLLMFVNFALDSSFSVPFNNQAEKPETLHYIRAELEIIKKKRMVIDSKSN